MLPLPAILIGLKWLAAGAALTGLVWFVDAIGDRREAKVRAEIAAEVKAADRRAADAEETWRTWYAARLLEREGVLREVRETLGTLASRPPPAERAQGWGAVTVVRSAESEAAAGCVALPAATLRQVNAIGPRAPGSRSGGQHP